MLVKQQNILRYRWLVKLKRWGELEPCGLSNITLRWISETFKGIARYSNGAEHCFHLDAGETLLKGFFSSKDVTSKDRALLIGELSNDVGVDVWTVGPSDLMAVGMDELADRWREIPPEDLCNVERLATVVLYFRTLCSAGKRTMSVWQSIGLSAHPTDPRFSVRTIRQPAKRR